MKFFLFLFYISYVRSDCLEFINNQSINECLIKKSTNHDIHIDHYYPECLQCTIQTLIQPENIAFEENNTCLTIGLQCIQFMFHDETMFEDFFQSYQPFVYNLFNTDNNTDQNTLHIIIKECTFEEINAEYIDRIFQLRYQAYRVVFLELHIQDQNIKINRDLLTITRLSIKLILVCGDTTKPKQTIYLIYNHQIILESQQDLCSSILIPSLSTIYPQKIIQSSSNVLLFMSRRKSKDIIRTIILLTTVLFCLLIIFIVCCLKYRHRFFKKSTKSETTSELSTSEDTSVEASLSLSEKSNLDFKLKQPLRGMRAIQLLENDI